MYSISRKHGVTSLEIPTKAENKETLKLSLNFAYLLPFNCKRTTASDFAKLIRESNDSIQAQAVADALQKVA